MLHYFQNFRKLNSSKISCYTVLFSKLCQHIRLKLKVLFVSFVLYCIPCFLQHNQSLNIYLHHNFGSPIKQLNYHNYCTFASARKFAYYAIIMLNAFNAAGAIGIYPIYQQLLIKIPNITILLICDWICENRP